MVRALKLPNQVPRPPADDWYVSVRLGVNAEDLHSATGPVDRPHGMADKQQIAAYERDLAPLIKKGRATYPAAKEKFLRGLPPRHSFAGRYRFIGKAGRFEDAFVNVESIAKGKIHGRIANFMSVVQNRKQGDVVVIPESEIQDWLIIRSDGTEEGNIIGKTLEKKYSPSR